MATLAGASTALRAAHTTTAQPRPLASKQSAGSAATFAAAVNAPAFAAAAVAVASATPWTTHTTTAHLPSLPSKQGAHATASFSASCNAAAVAAPVAATVTVVSLTHCATHTAPAQPSAVAATFAAAPSAV